MRKKINKAIPVALFKMVVRIKRRFILLETIPKNI